ncbi:glycogen debranching protein GlgX [Allobranchiibius sp. CTAmp26]|uniref:glycogen debranching protein GlgX n=1 Tax=Allobranchiibius sp. CTAmp26 TaxID=2815214 RepID=UPI001AA0C5C9|nr:glycogen debranching protein GlgX [Allobranchiibius sp. CTAmp26]MBO1755930.1 glycogen debranching protein GlgX [Allobranchiibius sp. CTAmp26]
MPALRRPDHVPPPYGATLTGDGAEFAVYAGHATGVQLCLFDDAGAERQVPMVRHVHGTWSTHVAGVTQGQRYGYRVDGDWDPANGQRHNPAKLLLDPYTRAVDGTVDWRPEVYGTVVDQSLAVGEPADVRDDRDSAAYVPRSVVVGDGFDWGDERAPMTAWCDTVIYETHVVGVTHDLPGVPQELRGTYAGLAHPATIAHLRRLGITTLELLPVHASVSEPHVVQRGMSNYWGYNTLGFFAPHLPYAAASDPVEAVAEFKGMVKLLHAAGIEVLLDVVYNHTCEQSAPGGSTLAWRGLDSRAYYRLDERGDDIDVTGCGNTLDLRHPITVRMVLDSLRYWVQEMHVDGFRFDLAVALARGRDDGYHPDHPFLMALRTDPVLSDVKLIAEPWDLGIHGWRTGQFPPPFGEWNDRFRDTVRTFWLPDLARDAAGEDGHGVRELGTRIAGSADLFRDSRRGPLASINFVTAHDGFTVADLTAYNSKHNGANGEGNRDGSDNNCSWNHGIEGHVDATEGVEALRRRSMRNLLGTLLLSAGVPMLTGGDEFGRTQHGNNNPYCQDSEISWYDWDLADWQRDLNDTVSHLLDLRRRHPVLRQRHFFPGSPVDGDALPALHWHALDGRLLTADQWNDGRTRTLSVVFDGADIDDDRLLLLFHGSAHDASVTLPGQSGVSAWKLLWDSRFERVDDVPQVETTVGAAYDVPPATLAIFRGV